MKLVLNQPKMCQFYDVRKREKERGGKREGGGERNHFANSLKYLEIFIYTILLLYFKT